VEHAQCAATRALITETWFFPAPEKKNPAVGTPGEFFCYRSLRFQVCGLAVARCARKRGAACCYCPAYLFSCSSTFLFFSNGSKFNRTLCDFALFSVGLRTHSSLGGDALYKAIHMPAKLTNSKTAG
jgi:hypothetical protein